MRYAGGYPMGAPDKACHTMKPVHKDNEPQTGPAPYTVKPSANEIVQGQKLQVTLDSSDGVDFAGYLLQARSQNGPNTVPLGVFTVDSELGKLLTCGAGIDVSILYFLKLVDNF